MQERKPIISESNLFDDLKALKIDIGLHTG